MKFFNEEYARKCWNDIHLHFPHVQVDLYFVMSNHIHGIVVITKSLGAKNFSPLPNGVYIPRGTSKTIGSIVRVFKIGVTKWARNRTPGKIIWQRNYYEHIMRKENDYRRIYEYVGAKNVSYCAKYLWSFTLLEAHNGNNVSALLIING